MSPNVITEVLVYYHWLATQGETMVGKNLRGGSKLDINGETIFSPKIVIITNPC